MVKLHAADRPTESVAVQTTAVEPIGNGAPLVGEQFTLTPVPVAIAVPYCTLIGWPVGDVSGAGEVGHVIVGGVFPPLLPPSGPFGFPQAAPVATAMTMADAQGRKRLITLGFLQNNPNRRKGAIYAV